MLFRLGLVAVAAMLLAGCDTIGCGESSQNGSAGGACGAHTTFFKTP